MTPTLHTNRLTLRPLTDDDVPDLHAIYSDPRAMRFMPMLPHTSIDQTRHHIIADTAVEGAIGWGLCLTDSNKVIGRINYLGQTRVPGMGYILHPDYWGQGLIVEACCAALDYAFAHIGYDRVELWIDETNTQSIRVAQKLGFGMKGRLMLKYHYESAPHFSLVWGMLAAAWRTDPSTATTSALPTTRFFSVEPVLMAHDIMATAHYYRDKLGFNIDFLYGHPPTHAGVSRGEWNGTLVSLQLSRVPQNQAINPAANLHIRVDANLDALYEQYRVAGVYIAAAPQDMPWGFREFAIKDINGHRLIFATYI